MNISAVSEPETAPVNPLNPLSAVLQMNRSCIVILKNYSKFFFFLILVSSNVSVASSTISSIDVLGEDLTNQKFGRLYRRWLKCANRTMKQIPKKV